MAQQGAVFVPFTAHTRMCPALTSVAGNSARARGTRLKPTSGEAAGVVPAELKPIVDWIARAGGTPLVVAEAARWA